MTDEDNPEWTEDDFARARLASALPPHVLAAFPTTVIRRPGEPGYRAGIEGQPGPENDGKLRL